MFVIRINSNEQGKHHWPKLNFSSLGSTLLHVFCNLLIFIELFKYIVPYISGIRSLHCIYHDLVSQNNIIGALR